ncbi:MAG: S8 family serine peptidase, partial [Lachnospiraceae bacterium]|nr:S8 family serine peptidase [Lachnospiraceae bacterium]
MDCREMIVSEDYMSIVLDFRLPEQYWSGEDFCYQPIDGNLGVYYINRRIQSPLLYSEYLYRYIPQLYGLESAPGAGSREFNPGPLETSGILTQQRAPLELNGDRTVIGLIDTGISYENPVFRYSDGSSRILAIWDQTDQSGEPPEGFAYGTLYTQEQINEALGSDDPHSIVSERDEIGHGTAMASVAAGSSLEEGIAFTGAAPQAQIVVVKLKPAKQHLREYYLIADDVPAYASEDLMFGVKFVQSFSIPFSRPAVICLGMGTSLGSHNGSSLFSVYLQLVARQLGCAVILSGGNEGNAAGHFRAPMTQQAQWAELRVGENTKGFSAQLWGVE